MRCTIKPVDGGLEAVWHDECLPFLAKLGVMRPAQRVSHIDPGPLVDERPTWVICWRGRFQQLFGESTTRDNEGKPFFTKRAAEIHETEELRQRYFGVK